MSSSEEGTEPNAGHVVDIEEETEPNADHVEEETEPRGLFNYAPTSNGEGPDLGDDIAAIRERVLGPRRTEDMTAAEGQAFGAALREKYQVDLNEESGAASLEDPALRAHVESARRRLADHQRAMLRLPKLEELRSKYLATMSGLSEVLRKIESEVMERREGVERGFRQGRVLADISTGREAHGYKVFGAAAQKDAGVQTSMPKASKEATAIAEQFEATIEYIEDVRKTLFVLRRDVDTFGDGLINLYESSEEDRRRMRELMALAGSQKFMQNAREPEHTIGERLLAAVELPEETGISATEHDGE